MNDMPGAKIDEASGLKKVIAEIIASVVHFLFCGKFRGFVGSVCDSQPTRPLSSSVSG
jgi:hypothetical protein